LPRVKMVLIKPSLIDSVPAKKIMRSQLRKEARIIHKAFNTTTRTWEHKPVFKEHTHLSMSDAVIWVEVETDDEIYRYVSEGTRPHTIVPKREGRRLVFKAGYKSKTTPRVIGSHKGGPFGKIVWAKKAKHPGTKARQFPAEIAKRKRPGFTRRMKVAWKRAARATKKSRRKR